MRYTHSLFGVHTEEMLYLYTQRDLGQLGVVEIHIYAFNLHLNSNDVLIYMYRA
jgi:hypothetical protein